MTGRPRSRTPDGDGRSLIAGVAVDDWLAHGPSHQLFRAGTRLLYRFGATRTAAARSAWREQLEGIAAAMAGQPGPYQGVALLDDPDELAWLVGDPESPGAVGRSAVPGWAGAARAAPARRAVGLLRALAPLHARGHFHGALTPARVGGASGGGPTGDLAIGGAATGDLAIGGAATGSPELDITGAANGGVPWIMDIACAEIAAAAGPLTIATPAFAELYPVAALVPPEVVRRLALSVATDVFGVAALYRTWADGVSPFAADGAPAMEVYARLRDGDFVALGDPATNPLDAALLPDPGARPSPRELLAALEAIAGAEPAGDGDRDGRPSRDNGPSGGNAEPRGRWSGGFTAKDPRLAPAPPGSAAATQRDKALARASLELALRTERRQLDEPVSRSRITWLVALLVALGLALLLPKIMSDRYGAGGPGGTGRTGGTGGTGGAGHESGPGDASRPAPGAGPTGGAEPLQRPYSPPPL